jgi:hypothetical protein
MEGIGELSVLMVTKCFYCEEGAKRVRLDSARALPLLHSAPVMQHFRTLTVIPVYALKRESFWSWTIMSVGELNHVGSEAEVVGESVAKVGRRGFSWVGVSGGGAGAVASLPKMRPAWE